ncbi:MAG: pyoverdine biosynthesis protein PvcA [Proteobacteria bacterium]|nr:pyoverdine biosynthesis protein PvcA [Pseudomonadota bacterium]
MNDSKEVQCAELILTEIMAHRRLPNGHERCAGATCPDCASKYLPKIISAVREQVPVTFVLPAFPAKSPNPEKVLGHLPDFAERLALRFLADLAQRIRSIYSRGVQFIICSDGRVFSDVVGMDDAHVSSYQEEFSALVKETGQGSITLVNLEDLFSGPCFDGMRAELMKRYGRSSRQLRQQVQNGAQASATQEEREANRMYRGITRFLFEDALHPLQTKTRSAIQKEVRERAYEVIRRSNAWSYLIAERFPKSVRLSIHPQICGSEKLGIRLVGEDCWMTPWHGVAVKTPRGFILMKHSEARALGAQLVFGDQERPSHFVLRNETLSPQIGA